MRNIDSVKQDLKEALSVQSTREYAIEGLFKYLLSHPSSLEHMDGSLKKSQKLDLLHAIENKTECTVISP
jgi:hypothetical protein